MVLLVLRDRARIKQVLRYFTKYLFSHIGLLALVISYCVGGAYMFAAIESPDVMARIRATVNASHRMEEQRRVLIETLVNKRCTVDFNETVRVLIEDYQRSLADAIQNHSYPGVVLEETDLIDGWVFPSALLFTLTIVTTIGYGHVTPKTPVGQILVIPYSLLGIPLMLLFLANIGEFMARSFRLGYARGCCFICWRRRKRNYDRDKERRRRDKDQRREENQTRKESIGDAEIGDHRVTTKNIDPSGGHTDGRHQSIATVGSSAQSESLSRTEEEEEEDEEDDSPEMPDDEYLNVPISLTILVAVLYLFIGAVLFATWNNWTWIQGAYFSFITLATIGFGDYIPGWQEAATTVGRIKLVISCLYIVFGLAVLSMSFNLMMDEMLHKFKWVGRQIGLIRLPKLPISHSSDGHESQPTTEVEETKGDNGETGEEKGKVGNGDKPKSSKISPE